MKVGVGYGDNPDSALAGRRAAQQALLDADRSDPCDMVLLFCTARHDQIALKYAVSSVVGENVPFYGGGAVGIITNSTYGYAGDQVGIACFWLDEVECEAVIEGGLAEDEEATGKRLGKKLAKIGTTQESPVVMFYDAVEQKDGNVRLLMATWLLQGIEQGLGFLPDLIGAGMQGDHICTPTDQFIGDETAVGQAIALKFDGLHIDSAIMHGCRPASPYYTVTKSDGPVILEINNEPAIDFIDGIIGSQIPPEEYPFFLLFGLNHGDRWGEYDEDNYASRLCLGIDPERRGIVMFEPDMVAGTEFQIMYRSLALDYMRPKIDNLFKSIGDRKPVFALYIDCAGRAAGYGGLDIEDAVVIQDAIGEDIPLLGLYTGVEIAALGGNPRGLDWTGVLVLFSEGEEDGAPKQRETATWENTDRDATKHEIPLDSAKKMIEQNVGKVLGLDASSIAIRNELEQKRRGFGLLSELSVSLRQASDYKNIFIPVTQRINAALNMQRTVVLIPNKEGVFTCRVLQGYDDAAKQRIAGQEIEVDEEFLDPDCPIIVNGADSPDRFKEIREVLELPFFVSTPVIVKDEVTAIIIAGRMAEQPPFLSRLGLGDYETVQAVGALLATVLVYQRLDVANKLAQSDVLTGLYNRGAIELQASEMLKTGLPIGQRYAFVMIDFDLFKQVNDSYGHIKGDEALRKLADVLRENFRSSDVIARLGGDEFAIFCSFANLGQLTDKVEKLLEQWRTTPLETGHGSEYYGTLSIGIAMAPQDGDTYKELFHKADIAMYTSKQNGRDQLTVFDVRTMHSPDEPVK